MISKEFPCKETPGRPTNQLKGYGIQTVIEESLTYVEKNMVVLAASDSSHRRLVPFRPERLFINQKVNEQFPTASAASNKLASGQFHSGAHETKGTATVFQLADGKKTLRLTDFATSNGPDVHVYLVAAMTPKTTTQ